MEKKQPTPRFDSEKLMTVNCLTRLIDRKLVRPALDRDADGSTARAVLELSAVSPHIDRLELVMLSLGDNAIRTPANPPLSSTQLYKQLYLCRPEQQFGVLHAGHLCSSPFSF